MTELRNGLSPTVVSGRVEMRTPDEVSAMLALKACDWGSKRIADGLNPFRYDMARGAFGQAWSSADLLGRRDPGVPDDQGSLWSAAEADDRLAMASPWRAG